MHPSYFNPSLSAYLKLSLRRQVEGSCSGRLGYIIAVTQDNLDQPEGADEDEGMRGRIKEDGQAVFRLRYQAIVYRPFRGEVVDGLVASVNKVRSYYKMVSVGAKKKLISLILGEPLADGNLCRCRSFTMFRFNSRTLLLPPLSSLLSTNPPRRFGGVCLVDPTRFLVRSKRKPTLFHFNRRCRTFLSFPLTFLPFPSLPFPSLS